mmetsp:Transcript_72677/g.210394  ORF Transcript_72677/g.210394 Transcript_72677/m.210394 type:complete len:101 (-) Transcript_72677:202-504(-)
MRLILHFSDTSTGGQQGLGGNTSTVDAGSTNIATSKDSSGQSLCSTVQSSSVSTDTASNHSYIKVKISIRHGQGRETCGPHMRLGRRKGRNGRYYNEGKG